MKLKHLLLAVLTFLAKSSHAESTKDDPSGKLFQLRPMQFLLHLKKNCCDPVTVVNAPPNWITKDDVIELSRYIESDERAAPVVSILSSTIPRQTSTVGAEARFLIRGYHEQRYPPDLYSGMTATKSQLPLK